MAKFKVGDKVRVVEHLKNEYLVDGCVLYPNSTRRRFENRIVTIRFVCSDGYYKIDELEDYQWTDEMFAGLADATATKSIKLEGKEMFKIKSYKVIGNKVVIVEFEDGDIQKSVCMDGDVFDAERGLEVCIMKHLLGKSKYHKVLKEANKQIVALDEKVKADKAEADKEANKKAKAAKNKAERKAKRRAENIADMTEAFTAALKANGIDASVKDVSESTLDKILSVFKK